MLRSLYLTLAYLTFFVLGAAAPFALTLGYLWVDTFRPQEIAYLILNMLPVSMIIGATAVGAYLLLDRRAPPRLNATTVLVLLLALWVTLTTMFWAVAPDAAWQKWDWAFKTLIFSAFVPFVIRSRIQIEAFLQIYLLALAANYMPVGIKTFLGGGGYGQQLALSGTDAMLGESSTLAAVSLMTLPFMLYLRAHTRILPRSWITDIFYAGLAVLALAAAVGTYARTALVGMIVVGTGMWLRSRHKLLFGLIGAAAAAAVMLLTSDAWNARISTIDNYEQDYSAFARILVWRWTLGFVAENPFGGGFESYLVNQIVLPGPDGQATLIRGKAFHSIYFEILGEHGWIGLGLFLGLVATTLLTLQAVVRRTRKIPEMLWCRELAFALQVSLMTLLACGAFIGIGFLPMLYYMFAISTALRQYVARAMQAAPSAGWRASPASAVLAGSRPLMARPRQVALEPGRPSA